MDYKDLDPVVKEWEFMAFDRLLRIAGVCLAPKISEDEMLDGIICLWRDVIETDLKRQVVHADKAQKERPVVKALFEMCEIDTKEYSNSAKVGINRAERAFRRFVLKGIENDGDSKGSFRDYLDDYSPEEGGE